MNSLYSPVEPRVPGNPGPQQQQQAKSQPQPQPQPQPPPWQQPQPPQQPPQQPQVPGQPTAEQKLRLLQLQRTDFFYLWREGDQQAKIYDKNARFLVYRHMTFPKVGEWPGHFPQGTRGTMYRIRKSPLKGHEAQRRNAEKKARELDGQLRLADMKVGKILGWGGLGIACLVEGTKKDGKPMKVVAKVALNKEENRAMAEEKRCHIRMAGARHIVQRVVIEEKGAYSSPGSSSTSSKSSKSKHMPPSKRERGGALLHDTAGPGYEDPEDPEAVQDMMDDLMELNKKNFREKFDARKDLLFIEFMKNGDMWGTIGKASSEGLIFPNHVLWYIFECLFRGCVAMAYPRAWAGAQADPEHENVPQIRESYQGRHAPDFVKSTLVHFDLDPKNVLVGDFDEDEHKEVPVVKIADLGLAQIVNWRFRKDAMTMWQSRKCGKLSIFTPEQFTEEWDWVRAAPIKEPGAGEGTAGNYHWWTNLYQAAQVMWQLITLCTIESPPVISEMKVRFEGGVEGKQWTYGGVLADPIYDKAKVCPDLRYLVMLCMSHKPSDRPNMEYLEWTLKEAMDRYRAVNKGPEAARKWCERFFNDAGTAQAQQPQRQTQRAPPPQIPNMPPPPRQPTNQELLAGLVWPLPEHE